jgi:hypothetical protein
VARSFEISIFEHDERIVVAELKPVAIRLAVARSAPGKNYKVWCQPDDETG